MNSPGNDILLSAELRLLLLACRYTLKLEARETLIAFFRATPFDWSRLYELTCFHRLRPILLHALKALPQELVSGLFLEQLHQECHHITLLNLHSTRELLRLSALFKKEQIEVVPFKGAFLSSEAYGDLGLREVTDIDLFFHPQDLGRIKKLMLSQGYVSGYQLTPGEEARHLHSGYDFFFDYFEEGQRLHHVEFHWQPAPRRCRIFFSLKELKPFVAPGAINGFPTPVFSPEATLLLTVIHHGGQDYWRSLRSVCDIAFLLQRNQGRIDWDLCCREAGKRGMFGILSNGIILAHQLLKTEIPPVFAGALSDPSMRRLTDRQISRFDWEETQRTWTYLTDYLNCLKYHYAVRDNFYFRQTTFLSQIAHILSPSQNDTHKGKIPSWLYPLLFITKPFRLLRRHLLAKN